MSESPAINEGTAGAPREVVRIGGKFSTLRWPTNVDATFSSNYTRCDDELSRLYEKATSQQWKIGDFDWSHEFNSENILDMPDGTLIMYDSDLWRSFNDKEKVEVRTHFHAWLLSQILHGEQGAMLCAVKLAQGEESLAARLCACAQAYDEARHIEVYGRLVEEKIKLSYPLSASLNALLEDTIADSRIDITNLGMQILVEGIALSIFKSIVAYSRDPFIKSIVHQILRDEARHFAVGRISLRRIYRGELSVSELSERREFLCEGIHVLYEHLCADDIWEPLGLNRRESTTLVRESKMANSLRRGLFRNLVPAVKDLGLLDDKVASLLDSIGMLDYASLPIRLEH